MIAQNKRRRIIADTHPTAASADMRVALNSPNSQPADTGKRASRRPAKSRKKAKKPYPSFPLTPHPNGQFCKKIRGQLRYFGTIADPEAALKSYQRYCDALHTGKIDKVPRGGATTVAILANEFLRSKEEKRENGELTPGTFVEYHRHCERMVEFFGGNREVAAIDRNDLEEYRAFLRRGVNATTLSNRVGGARSILKFAYDDELIEAPIRFGAAFKRPKKLLLRKAKAEAGRVHFHAEEIRRILAVAPTGLKAMVLLGINCGLGNTDIGELPLSRVDLEQGMIDFPRVKTGIERRCPLWPETAEAIRASILDTEKRKITRSPGAEGLMFVTRQGHPFVRVVYESSRDGRPTVITHDAVKTAMQRAMQKAGIDMPGLGFYGLRRSFETIGSGSGHQVAVDHIMGHAPLSSDMGAVYRQGVPDEALEKVTDHVRDWLFGAQKKSIRPRSRTTA
jgi:integrase